MKNSYKGFKTGRHDYCHPLKDYRVVRKVLAKQQGLSDVELETLVFLDDEYFTKSRFADATMTMTWDTNRFDRLETEGWIELHRPHKPPRQAALYRPTGKSHHLIKRIYRILRQEEDLPLSSRRNPKLMKVDENLSYSEKLLKKAALLMQQERHSNRYGNE